MSQKGEYGEPWRIAMSEDGYEVIIENSGHEGVAFYCEDENKINRIIACINACNGLDPASVPQMAAEIERLNKEVQALNHQLIEISSKVQYMATNNAILTFENERLKACIPHSLPKDLRKIIEDGLKNWEDTDSHFRKMVEAAQEKLDEEIRELMETIEQSEKMTERDMGIVINARQASGSFDQSLCPPGVEVDTGPRAERP